MNLNKWWQFIRTSLGSIWKGFVAFLKSRALRYFLWMAFRFAVAAAVLVGVIGFIFWGIGSTYSLEWEKALKFLSWYNKGIVVTIELFIFSAMIALALGLVVALLRLVPFAPVRDLAGLYIHIFRNLPALVVLLLFFFGLGQIIQIGSIEVFDRKYSAIFIWSVIAFGVYESSYLAEIFRAGIQSVHQTQIEAAQSLGMGYFRTMWYVILPQAFRVILPPMTGIMVALVKETALIYLVGGVGDLTYQVRQLAIPSRPYVFEFYTILAAYYLSIVIPMSLLSQWLESRLGISKARRQVVG